MLYGLLAGYFPFRADTEKALYRKISAGLFQMPDAVSFDAKRLLTRCLSIDPNKRPTITELFND